MSQAETYQAALAAFSYTPHGSTPEQAGNAGGFNCVGGMLHVAEDDQLQEPVAMVIEPILEGLHYSVGFLKVVDFELTLVEFPVQPSPRLFGLSHTIATLLDTAPESMTFARADVGSTLYQSVPDDADTFLCRTTNPRLIVQQVMKNSSKAQNPWDTVIDTFRDAASAQENIVLSRH